MSQESDTLTDTLTLGDFRAIRECKDRNTNAAKNGGAVIWAVRDSNPGPTD